MSETSKRCDAGEQLPAVIQWQDMTAEQVRRLLDGRTVRHPWDIYPGSGLKVDLYDIPSADAALIAAAPDIAAWALELSAELDRLRAECADRDAEAMNLRATRPSSDR